MTHYEKPSAGIGEVMSEQKLSERPWSVEHDGPSRPIIFTPDRRMLSVSEFSNGRWVSGENEEKDCDKIVAALNRVEALETQLAEARAEADQALRSANMYSEAMHAAIRERDEALKAAKGVGHDWLELMEERDGYKAKRDALAKALRKHHQWHLDIGRVIFPATAEDSASYELDLSAEYCDSGLYEETTEVLAALERPAPAEESK